MTERNGVRVGQRVRDIDGKALGRVTGLYDWGFKVTKGFPILFRTDFVARYDELSSVRDGELVLARSDRDLFELAAGGLPASWRVRAPPDFPTAATPAEARGVMESLAARSPAAAPAVAHVQVERVAREAGPERARVSVDASGDREYVRTRGQSAHAPPPQH